MEPWGGNLSYARASWAALCVAVLLIAGCARQMEPARRSLGDIQAAIIAASPDAATYVPDRLAAVQIQLGSLEAAFDRRDYAAVLARAPAVMNAAQGLAAQAAAHKAAHRQSLGDQWTSFAAALPGKVDGVQRRLDALGVPATARRSAPPPPVDPGAARGRLAAAESLWSKSQAAFATGNLEEAVATAQRVATQLDTLAGEIH
jgi:hypothetical protein